jgi:hypothetical protein
MRTLIVSDLHLGSGSGSDVLGRPEPRAALLEALQDVDRLVLLGDVLELRHGPPREAMAAARPFFEDLGGVFGVPPAREVVLCAGNHDHLLVDAWLDERALQAPEPLSLEQRIDAETFSPMLERIAEWLSPRGLSGPVGAPGRVRDPRALPRLPSDGAHARALERRRCEPHAGTPRRKVRPSRGLRGRHGPCVRVEGRGGQGSSRRQRLEWN